MTYIWGPFHIIRHFIDIRVIISLAIVLPIFVCINLPTSHIIANLPQ